MRACAFAARALSITLLCLSAQTLQCVHTHTYTYLHFWRLCADIGYCFFVYTWYIYQRVFDMTSQDSGGSRNAGLAPLCADVLHTPPRELYSPYGSVNTILYGAAHAGATSGSSTHERRAAAVSHSAPQLLRWCSCAAPLSPSMCGCTLVARLTFVAFYSRFLRWRISALHAFGKSIYVNIYKSGRL